MDLGRVIVGCSIGCCFCFDSGGMYNLDVLVIFFVVGVKVVGLVLG